MVTQNLVPRLFGATTLTHDIGSYFFHLGTKTIDQTTGLDWMSKLFDRLGEHQKSCSRDLITPKLRQ
jgi:hypothetical protein